MTRARRNAVVLTVIAIIAALAVAFWWTRPQQRPARPAGTAVGAPATPESSSAAPAKHADSLPDPAIPEGARRRPPASSSHAQREALRDRILRSSTAQPSTAAERAAADATHPADPRNRPGKLVDRVGGRETLVAHLNRDFMPLARECIARAQEETPALEGMLALDVEVIADAQQGGIVEHARAAAGNPVNHPGLIECIAQTALSVTFPPPLPSGREVFQLTLRITPASDAGAL